MLHADNIIQRYETAQSSTFREYRTWKESKWGEDALDEVEIEDEDVYLELSLPSVFANPLIQVPPLKELVETIYSRIAAHAISLVSVVTSVGYYYRHPRLIPGALKDLFVVLLPIHYTPPSLQRLWPPTPPGTPRGSATASFITPMATPTSSVGSRVITPVLTAMGSAVSSISMQPRSPEQDVVDQDDIFDDGDEDEGAPPDGDEELCDGICGAAARASKAVSLDRVELEEGLGSIPKFLLRWSWAVLRFSVFIFAGLIAASFSLVVVVIASCVCCFLPSTWFRFPQKPRANQYSANSPRSVSLKRMNSFVSEWFAPKSLPSGGIPLPDPGGSGDVTVASVSDRHTRIS